MVCKIAMAFGRTVEDVMNDGYFKNHRTYDILSEIEHERLEKQVYAASAPHATDEDRQQFIESLVARQPRMHQPKYSAMPENLKKEIEETSQKFTEEWNSV